MAAKFTRLYHYRGETQSYTVPLSADEGDVENVTFAIRDKENGQILVEFDRDTYPSLFVLGNGSMTVTLDAVGMSGSSTNGIVSPQLFSKNGVAYLRYDVTTQTPSVTLVEQFGTFALRADIAVPVDPQQLALRLTTDIVDALTNGEEPSQSNPFLTASGLPPSLPSDVLDAIANANAPSVLNPFATMEDLAGAGVTLQMLKDYSYPADATVVDPRGSGDYSQLSVALAELGAIASSNKRKKIVVRGPIVEGATVQAVNYVDVYFQEGASVDLNSNNPGAGIRFNAITDPSLVWQAICRRSVKFIRTGGGGASNNYALEITNPSAGIRPTLRGLVFRAEINNTTRNYGAYLRSAVVDDCEFYGSGTDRAYGLFADGDVVILRSDGYGGNNTLGGFGGTVPCGIVLAPNMTGRMEDSRGYGGNAGSGVEAHGIWVFCYAGQNAVSIVNCRGYGGTSDSGFNDGINCHKSAQANLKDCFGISGNRGSGFGVYGQSGNYARYVLENCVGICLNQDATMPNFHGINYGDGAARDRIIGGMFIGSPFVPSSGANIDINAGWAGADGDNAYSEWLGVTLIGGNAGLEAQSLTTHQVGSHALRLRATANPIRFAGCHFLSNINSAAIKIASTATVANIQFDGGDAKSMNPTLQKAIESDVAWNNAEIYGMTLRGGISNNIVPKTPTMVGTNIVP